MLNEIMIEGIVARETWTYDKDSFFRIACYRDTDRPAKVEAETNREAPDYVTIRVIGGASKMIAPRKGQVIRVYGYLGSREYKESVLDFIKKAKKKFSIPEINPQTDAAKTAISNALIERSALEVVALKIIALDEQMPTFILRHQQERLQAVPSTWMVAD